MTEQPVERWENYHDILTGLPIVQYDYRAPDGAWFICIAPSVAAARARRDAWEQKEQEQE